MRRSYPLILLILATLLGACGQNNPPPLPTILPSVEPTATYIPTATLQAVTNEVLAEALPAQIRIVNAVPDSAPLNVFAGFSAVATNLAYKQYTESTSINSGSYVFKVLPSGTNTSAKPLFEKEITLPSGKSLIALLVKRANTIEFSLVIEEQVAVKSDENIIHMINGLSEEIPVQLRSEDSDLTEAIGIGSNASTDILPAQPTSLIVNFGNKALEYSAELQGQVNTTLIAVGTTTEPAIIQYDTTAPTRITVRATNASPDLTSVDVYLNDTLLSSQVLYGKASERQNIASGEYTVKIYASGADRNSVEPLTGEVITLQNADYFNLMLIGHANQLSIIAFSEDLAPTPADRARLAFVNTIAESEEVDVQTPAKTIVGIPTLFFGQSPSVMSVEPGSYNFLMSSVDKRNIRSTIEAAENIQLEAGYSYLYLVTGRQDGRPIVLIDNVKTVTATEAEQTPETGTIQLRFINSVEGQSLDFTINGLPISENLNYGEGTSFLQITEPNITFSVNVNGQEAILGQEALAFEFNNTYTIIAYQMNKTKLGLLAINDNNLIFDGTSPHIRFINVSAQTDNVLSLAVSDPNPASNPTPEPVITEEPTQDPNQATILFTLPFGIEKLVDVAAGNASSGILMANGTYDIDLIETERNKLVLTLHSLQFAGDIHLDIIAFQASTGNVKAFIVPYPKPQA